MTILAAWLGNPTEYWQYILGLIMIVVGGVYALRKYRGQSGV